MILFGAYINLCVYTWIEVSLLPTSTLYGKACMGLSFIFVLVNAAVILHVALLTSTYVRLEGEIKISEVKEITQVEIERSKKSKF